MKKKAVAIFTLIVVLVCGILVGCNRHSHNPPYRTDDWEKWETMPAEMLKQFPDYKKLEREGITLQHAQIPCCEKSIWGNYDEWGKCIMSFDVPGLANDYKNRGITDEQFQAWTETESLFTFDGEDLSEGMEVTKTADSYPNMKESIYSMEFYVKRTNQVEKSNQSDLDLEDFAWRVDEYYRTNSPGTNYWRALGSDTFDVDGVSVKQTVYASRHVPRDAKDKQHVIFFGHLQYQLPEISVSITYAAYDCVISDYPPEQKPITDPEGPLPHQWSEEDLNTLYQRIRNRVKEVSTYTLQRVWTERTI